MQKLIIIESVYKNDNPVHLKLSLDSIFAQTYKYFKVLLYVDGSVSDDIWKVIKSFSDEKFEVMSNPENMGLAVALNTMLERCRDFEFIARMDADDIAMPDRLEKQLAFLELHPDVDVVGGAINEIDEEGNNRGKITKYPCSPDECRAFFAKRNPVAHPTVVFRRSFFEKAGWRYPTDFIRNEDTRLWHEGYKHGCVITNVPDVVLNFRMTDSMFKNRRNGKAFAKSQLELRKIIKKDLGYGLMADVYAYAMYLLMISPSWLLKLAYKIMR